MGKVDLSSLADKWESAYVTRNEISRFTGGMSTKASMAYFDSKGEGPDEKILINKKIAYPVESVIRWLESRAEIV